MMMDWLPTDLLWRSALAVIPLAIIVALFCRFVPCRPSTRHTLWLAVLIVLVAAPFLPSVPLPAATGSAQAQAPDAPALLAPAPAPATADVPFEPSVTPRRFAPPVPVDQITRGDAARPSPPPAPRRSSPRLFQHSSPVAGDTDPSGVARSNSFAHVDAPAQRPAEGRASRSHEATKS